MKRHAVGVTADRAFQQPVIPSRSRILSDRPGRNRTAPSLDLTHLRRLIALRFWVSDGWGHHHVLVTIISHFIHTAALKMEYDPRHV